MNVSIFAAHHQVSVKFIFIHSVKKVPGINHSKIPLKEIVRNLFDAKLALLSSILTWSSSAICHLVCSQCSMLSVHLKCVSQFFQWIRISNKEFVSNFALQMEFRVRNRWKCYRRPSVNRLYQKYVHMSGTVHPKTVEMWWKICLALVGHQLSVSHESIRTILNDCLGMKRVTARLVPKYLNFL